MEELERKTEEKMIQKKELRRKIKNYILSMDTVLLQQKNTEKKQTERLQKVFWN